MQAPCWNPPASWSSVTTIDAHTGGEPFRVVTGGFPALEGSSILEYRRYAKSHFDDLRRALMWEPRGHADMYGCIITPPVTETADFGILFIHNEGFSTMCGHGIIGVVTVALETGMLDLEAGDREIRIDTPAGLVVAFAEVDGNRVQRVRFRNVPSFLALRDVEVEVPGLGRVRYDLAFGGAFYAYVDAESFGLKLEASEVQVLIEHGTAIKKAIMAEGRIEHPTEPDLGFLYGVIFVGPPHQQGSHSRNVCIFADGEVDRSPTGTGVSGRVAIHHARGELAVGEEIVIESILGTCFSASVAFETTFGSHRAIVPEVSGSAWITGRHEFFFNPEDPLSDGFLLR